MGPSLANEALLCATRLPASRLAAAGFVNRVFPTEKFAECVAEHVQKTFGPSANLDPQSVLRIKRLIRERDVRAVEAANVVEHFEGLERFAEGVPQGRFVSFIFYFSRFYSPRQFLLPLRFITLGFLFSFFFPLFFRVEKKELL